MADVTIAELAKMVGVPVERLLDQVKEAGLPQTAAQDPISNEQRTTLLLSLKRKHGDDTTAITSPKRITLKRKTPMTLKAADGQGRTKPVNVEVRKKRTYVKRSVEKAQLEAAERERQAAEQRAREEAERKAEEEARKAQEEAAAKAAAAQVAEQTDQAAPKAAAQPAVEAPPAEAKPEARHHKKTALKKDAPRVEEEESERKPAFRKKEKSTGKKRGREDFILEDDQEFDSGARRRGRRKGGVKEHKFEKPTEFIVREI